MSASFQQQLKQLFSQQPLNRIYQDEKELIDRSLNNLFGYFILQLGCISQENLMQHSRVNVKVLLDSVYPADQVILEGIQFVQSDLDYLPIGKDKVDQILLPHTLETADDPLYLLRQLDAMLLPEGHLVITGFNPKGCWVWRHRWFHRNRLMKSANLILPRRIKEWLGVLGYEIQKLDYTPIRCSSSHCEGGFWRQLLERIERLMQKLGFEFGNAYCLVAKKKVDAPTLVGVRWRMPRWQSIRGGALSNKVMGAKSESAMKNQHKK
ncbi:Methyltransferase type 11 [uncultured Thiomicrorhabdus sp.]